MVLGDVTLLYMGSNPTRPIKKRLILSLFNDLRIKIRLINILDEFQEINKKHDLFLITIIDQIKRGDNSLDIVFIKSTFMKSINSKTR